MCCFRDVTDENANFISLYLVLYSNVPVLLILLLEKLIAKVVVVSEIYTLKQEQRYFRLK
jgi:hypothetical protein